MPDQVVTLHEAAPARRVRGASYRCDYLTDSITVLSDGRVTCGFDDPFGLRDYGNIRDRALSEILANAQIASLRARLDSGVRCADCHLYTRVQEGDPPPVPPAYPRRLILETTIRCQLRCRNTSCDLNNDRSFKVREESFLPVEVFRKLMDEAGPHLKIMYFFNYGEPFLHPRAVEMLEYARRLNPRMIIATSTNGLLFARGDLAERIVAGRLLNSINFTIAGCDDPTYQVYHKAGSFEHAFEGMRRVVAAKRRYGISSPLVKWRYLLFNWNDSDEHVERARRMARECGIDELRMMLCSAPLEGRSWRRAPGTAGFDAIEDIAEYEQHYQRDPFGDRGLYPPESDAGFGTYCWTSRRARLEVAGGPQAVLLLARRGDAAAHEVRAKLALPWGEQEAVVGDEAWAINRIAVPERARGRPVPVEVHVDEPFIAMRHRASHDTRELGVMVSLAFAEPQGRCDAPRWPTVHGVAAGQWVESAPVTVRGDAAATSIAVVGGEYSVDGGPFRSAPALVGPAARVRLRHRAADPGMGRSSALVLGGTVRELTSVSGAAPFPTAAEVEESEPAGALPSLASLDPAHVLTLLYRDLLGRDPDPEGLAWWSEQVRAGRNYADVADFLLRSDEFAQRTSPVVRVYLACAQCVPDFLPLRGWVERYWAGQPLNSIANVLMKGGEFVLRYGDLADEDFPRSLLADIAWPPHPEIDSAPRDRAELLIHLTGLPRTTARLDHRVHVAMVYVGLLRRRPDPSGWPFWVDQCESGGLIKLLDVAMGTPEFLRRLDSA